MLRALFLGLLFCGSLIGGQLQRIEDEILSQLPKEYFFKKSDLLDFLAEYSEEELMRIQNDFWHLHQVTFEHADRKPLYVATAGGPGSGKTTLLYHYMDESPVHFAFIDPDRSCLFRMSSTYLWDKQLGYLPEECYEKWRGASNFISNTLVGIALGEGYAIAHGTTLTSPHVVRSLKAISKRFGYERELLHITADEALRIESVERVRERGEHQATDDDMANKGHRFFHMLMTYAGNFERIGFYYRPEMEVVIQAALLDHGHLSVLDEEALEQIEQLHEQHAPGLWHLMEECCGGVARR